MAYWQIKEDSSPTVDPSLHFRPATNLMRPNLKADPMDINELAMSISQEFVLWVSIGCAARPEGVPARLLRLVWANPE